MSRKISVGAALALALLMVAASIPLTMIYAQRQQNKLIPDLPALIGRFDALDEIKKKVDDNFYMNPTWDAVNAAMVRGYIEGLNDPESRYLSAEEYQNYTRRLRGEASELGIELRYSPDVVGLVVDQVKEGSTAAVSGLREGDHIIKAESGGKALSIQAEVSPEKAEEEIEKFYAETAVAADTASLSITITYEREKVPKQPVNIMLGSSASTISKRMMNSWTEEGKPPQKNVGYIKINQFFRNTADQIEEAIRELSEQDAESYILDVRGCREGDLESVRKAIDLFASLEQGAGAMLTVRHRDGGTTPYSATSKNIMIYTTNGYVAVLMNRATGGVAELFAYNLRAYNPETVFLVGDRTRGGNTVQEPFPLSSVGGAALLTIGTVVPYGVPVREHGTWNAQGVQPGSFAKADEKRGDLLFRISGAENQVQGALLLFHQKANPPSNA